MTRRKTPAPRSTPSRRELIDPTTFKGATNVPDHVKEARLDAVEMLMASGVSPYQIAEHCRTEYGLADRTSRDYQQTVRERWLAESTAARPELRRRLEKMIELCFARAMERGETHAAIRASVELARLHGLYRPGDAPDNREPDQHLHQHLHAHATIVQIDAKGMTPIERNAEIAQLEERRRRALSAKPARVPAAARLQAILKGKVETVQ